MLDFNTAQGVAPWSNSLTLMLQMQAYDTLCCPCFCRYSAPELTVRADGTLVETFDQSVDVYAFGMVLSKLAPVIAAHHMAWG
jgi:hypothetical protein